jgi:hypothetical protein
MNILIEPHPLFQPTPFLFIMTSKQYNGLIYVNNPATRGWSPLVSGPVTLSVAPAGKDVTKWCLLANKGQDTVWRVTIELDKFRYKSRDGFIQLHVLQANGEKQTYGFKIKEPPTAQELEEELTAIMATKTLTLLLPSGEQLFMTFSTV